MKKNIYIYTNILTYLILLTYYKYKQAIIIMTPTLITKCLINLVFSEKKYIIFLITQVTNFCENVGRAHNNIEYHIK